LCPYLVIPAEAGIQSRSERDLILYPAAGGKWTPAFTGVTTKK